MTPNDYKKMKSDIIDLKLHCSKLYNIAAAQRDQLEQQRETIEKQSEQIAELQMIVSELYNQFQISDEMIIPYSEIWLKNHTGFYYRHEAQKN